jgi:hypothetical protein
MSTSQQIDFDRLFRLYDPLATRPFRLSTAGYSDWVSSELASDLFTGRKSKPPEILRLRAYQGGQPAAFLWSDLSPLVCVSSRVTEVLSAECFRGWSTYPIEVYDRNSIFLPGYSGFSITGRAGKRDRSRSQIVTRHTGAPGGEPYEVYRGLYFDEASWDGSDVFLVGGIKVVTEAVRKTFKRNRITNVRFTPLTEVEIDVFLDRFS